MKSEQKNYINNEYRPLNLLQRKNFKKLHTDKEVLEVGMKLVSENFSRAILITKFISEFRQVYHSDKIEIAVIGGYKNEPEVRILKYFGYSVNVTTFGVENEDFYLDLNLNLEVQHHQKFDLVLCSQVLEHVYNHENFFKSIVSLTKPGGFAWISCPASNIPHVLDSYYSAGVTAEYLAKNLGRFNIEILNFGQIGSIRLYKTVHTLRTWPTVKGYYNPLLYGDNSRPRYRQMFFLIRYIHRNFGLLFLSSKLTDDIRVATESWIFLKAKLKMEE
jgi:SAM-dependent methyltransferase